MAITYLARSVARIEADSPRSALEAVNAFLPANAVILSGTVSGDVALSGALTAMVINGGLAFTDGTATMPLTGTTLTYRPTASR